MRPAANWLVRVCTLADRVYISWSANIYVPDSTRSLRAYREGRVGLVAAILF